MSHGADDLRRILLSSETFAEIDLFPGGTIGLPLEMGWDASRLFADEANIVSGSAKRGESWMFIPENLWKILGVDPCPYSWNILELIGEKPPGNLLVFVCQDYQHYSTGKFCNNGGKVPFLVEGSLLFTSDHGSRRAPGTPRNWMAS